MPKFLFRKLVRDKIVENMLATNGQEPDYRTLSDEEFVIELQKKLLEEVTELNELPRDELLGELADVQEIINILLSVANISLEELEKEMKRKRNKAGGFAKRLYVESNTVPEKSSWADYYRGKPDQYPEIIE